jgi:predicted tellurium resistance membrane protein TerC
MVEFFSSPEIWMSLLTLTFLEIVLGVDNIIFISIASAKLPEEHQQKATMIGLALAMILRVVLLFGINILTAMEKPWFHIDFIKDIHGHPLGVSGQALILAAGGLFLLYKSVTEIHHKLEGESHAEGEAKKGSGVSLSSVIVQITIINIVFSIDSILTAVGMTTGLEGSFNETFTYSLVVMIIAVIFSVAIMMAFAVPVGKFVNKHPTIQMLGMSFLILIAFLLIAEAAHMVHLIEGSIPKGYLYFAIAFSLFVEMLNMKMRKGSTPVQLHGVTEMVEEEQENICDACGQIRQ